MEFDITRGRFLRFASQAVRIGEDLLSQALHMGWMKADGSYASRRDVEMENSLASEIEYEWPGMAVLKEEESDASPPRGKAATMPRVETFASIDGLDGTAEYMAGRREWSLSTGIIHNGIPIAGFVTQPALQRSFAAFKGEGVLQFNPKSKQWIPLQRKRAPRPTIGTDYGPNSPQTYLDEILRVVARFNTRPTNLPAVAGGIEVLVGSARCWWSHTAHHWDMAAITMMIQEIGGVAECIEGTPVPWTETTRLPPLLLAESSETAEEIRFAIASYEENRKKLLQSIRH
jgi:fructose-1,6-bisphosphatase/inositol monophosphatase family enzyme